MQLKKYRQTFICFLILLMVSIPGSIAAQHKIPIQKLLKENGISFILSPDVPHWGNGIDCSSCHVVHTSLDAQLNKVKGNANLCMSCHNPVGIASNKPFTSADRAEPGISGTSHAWEVPAMNIAHGANPPVEPEMAARVYADSIVCSTCHNQHKQTFPPFLRASNDQNAICKDCHSIRNVGSYRDSPDYIGSHPVGLVYPTSDSRFYSSPQNPNLPLVDPDRVECTSCHSPHYANSGDANGGEGDGFLLNAINNDQLCQSCHTYPDHEGMNCLICHQPHNPNRNNIFLIRDYVQTPNSGVLPVVFLAETGKNSFADGGNTTDGICEVCHNKKIHRKNWNCTECHPHHKGFAPSGCKECHNSPQNDGDGIPAGGRRAVTNEFAASSHHVSTPVTDEDCKVCHDQATHMDGYLDLYDPDIDSTYRAITFLDGALTQFCLNCHDGDGALAHGGLTPFSDNVNVIDVSTFYTTSGHGKENQFPLLTAQGPVTDPHSGNVHLYSSTGNAAANVSCTRCHEPHGSNNGPILKYANNQANTLCSECHPTATSGSGYYLTYHNLKTSNYEASKHGGLLCTNCHDPHGTANTGMVTNSVDALCTNCHSGKNSFRDLGTVSYNHGNLECSTCHNPHSTGYIPFLIQYFEQATLDSCTSSSGQRLPIISDPPLGLKFCGTCHVDIFGTPQGHHAITSCLICHGWWDEPVLNGYKTFVNFKIHPVKNETGEPLPNNCGICHFGGNCGINIMGSELNGRIEQNINYIHKSLSEHPEGEDCLSCHIPHAPH